ncbi:MAG: hypothetical protein R3F61_24880 [Myxococcota bacterium]
MVASVGPDGGTLVATSDAGDTLTLDIPEGALSRTVEVTITPLAAGEDDALFRVEPAGLAFAVPATLSLTVDDDDAGFTWIDGDGRSTLGGTVESGVLTLPLPTLGYRTSAGSQARGEPPPLESGEGRIAGGPIDCDTVLGAIPAAYQKVKATGTPDDVGQFLSGVVAIKARCDAQRIVTQIAQYCTDYQEAVITALDSPVSADDELAKVLGPLVASHAAVLSSGSDCDVSTFDSTMRTKMEQHVAALRARYAETAFGDSLETHLDHFDEVIRYEGNCQLAGIAPDSCGPLVNGLYPDVLDSLRSAAYADCRATQNPQSIAALYIDDRDPGQLAERDKPFFRFARYTNAALEEDVLQCASMLELTVTDDARTVPDHLPEQARTLGGGATPGNHSTETSIAAPDDGAIVLGGVVHAPPCTVEDPAQDALVVRVNGTEVDRSGRSGTRYLAATDPIHLFVEDLLEVAALPTAGGSFDLEIVREGEGCPSFPSPRTLYTVHVAVGEPLLTATMHASSSATSYMPTSADCEEDNDDGVYTSDTLPAFQPLPVELDAGLASVSATLVGLDTLEVVGTWAALGSISATCADGEIYTADNYGSFQVYVDVVPRRDIVLEALIYDDLAVLQGCTPEAGCTRLDTGSVLDEGQTYLLSVGGSGSNSTGTTTFIGRFSPAPAPTP